jgi:hypothetical protein
VGAGAPGRRDGPGGQGHEVGPVQVLVARDAAAHEKRMAVEPAFDVVVHLVRRIQVRDGLAIRIVLAFQDPAEPVAAVVHAPDLVRPRPEDELLGVANARDEELLVPPLEIVRPELLPLATHLIRDVAAVTDAGIEPALVNEERTEPVLAAAGQLSPRDHRPLLVGPAGAGRVAAPEDGPALGEPQPALEPEHRLNGRMVLHKRGNLLVVAVIIAVPARLDLTEVRLRDEERPLRVKCHEPRSPEVRRHGKLEALPHPDLRVHRRPVRALLPDCQGCPNTRDNDDRNPDAVHTRPPNAPTVRHVFPHDDTPDTGGARRGSPRFRGRAKPGKIGFVLHADTIRKFSHNSLSEQQLETILSPANWLCFARFFRSQGHLPAEARRALRVEHGPSLCLGGKFRASLVMADPSGLETCDSRLMIRYSVA